MCRAQIRGQAFEKRPCVSFRITSIFLAHKRPPVILVCGCASLFSLINTPIDLNYYDGFSYKRTVTGVNAVGGIVCANNGRVLR